MVDWGWRKGRHVPVMNRSILPPVALLHRAREYTHRQWISAVLLGLLPILAVGLATLTDGFIPQTFDGEAVDKLLDLIANAMLVVISRSLTVMVPDYVPLPINGPCGCIG